MTFDLQRFVAIYVGYALPLGLLAWISRRMPATWPAPPDATLTKPRRDLLVAAAVVAAVFLLNVMYTSGHLLPHPQGALAGKLVFLLDLTIIWSPLAAALLWRRQGLSTCLLEPRGLPRKLAWAAALSAAGMVVTLLVEGRLGALAAIPAQLGKLDPIQAVQSLVLFLGVGFVLVRLAAAAGRWTAVLACSALYGLVKYPYYLSYYHMSALAASQIIAFSILVALVVLYVVLDRGDVLAVAILHFFMDWIQQL